MSTASLAICDLCSLEQRTEHSPLCEHQGWARVSVLVQRPLRECIPESDLGRFSDLDLIAIARGVTVGAPTDTNPHVEIPVQLDLCPACAATHLLSLAPRANEIADERMRSQRERMQHQGSILCAPPAPRGPWRP